VHGADLDAHTANQLDVGSPRDIAVPFASGLAAEDGL
jgi:hypothetical protein